MARVCWTDRAEASVLEIGRFIIEQTRSRQRGLDVISRIEEKCRRYSEFPEGGTLRPDLGAGLRCFPVDSLIVIYRPIEDGTAIILVAHGHQDVRTIVEKMFGGGG
jgi:plasmid stabilization system protein ParE